MDLSKYQLEKPAALPAHRFQEIVLAALTEFKVDAKGKGMIWGRIGLKKKQNNYSNSMVEQKIQYAINETRELKPKKPGRYFVKLVYKYF